MSDYSAGIARKDPRKAWILRNRLHPLHDQVVGETQGPVAVVRGPSGLIRKNPHAVGFIGPNGIKRIDRLGGSAAAASGSRRAQVEDVLPLITIDSPADYLAVVVDMNNGELSSHDKDVLGQARQLADSLSVQEDSPTAELATQFESAGHDIRGVAVLAVVFGEVKVPLGSSANPDHALGLAGADRVLVFDDASYSGFAPEAQLEAMLAVERDYEPTFWLFPDTHLNGNDRALRLSARLGERPAMHAWQVKNGAVVSRGGSDRTDITRAFGTEVAPRILSLASECAMPVDEARYEARLLELPAVPDVLVRIEDAGSVAVDPNQIALAEAEFILSAGNGIHDWDQFHEAARVLGATEGASRVAVDDGYMPRSRQVGATGTWVTARVYIAVGISGAVQHLQGIGSCDKVVAINTDSGCDMVKRADLSLIGDSQELLAALIQRVQEGTSADLNPGDMSDRQASTHGKSEANSGGVIDAA